MKKVSLMLFLSCCMLVSGCGGSNSSNDPIPTYSPIPTLSSSPTLTPTSTPQTTATATPSQTKSVTVTLPSKYKINGVSYDLPSGKSWRIIACGNTSANKEVFQEHVFTQTGASKTFTVPSNSTVASFLVHNTIALDGSFVDDEGASYIKGRYLTVAKQQTTVGSITFSETDQFVMGGSVSSMTKISDLVNSYQKQFNLKFNVNIK